MKNYLRVVPFKRIAQVLLFAVASIFSSCKTAPEKKELSFDSQREYQETIIASHQAYLKIEKEKIKKFIASSGYSFDSTGTGLRFHVYQKTQGAGIGSGEIAVMQYTLSDLEGKQLYATRPELAHEFAVDYDEVESGLHEGIKKMRVGEKAILILPAHIAHGITGDQAAIPSQTTLVYDIHLLGVK